MARVWLGQAHRIRFLGLALALGLTATMLLVAGLELPWLLILENTFLDFRFQARGEREPSSDIVVVAIDEKSLTEVGRWPWSRDKQADLVLALAADGAKVIGLDLIYAEPEVSETLRALRALRQLVSRPGSASPLLRQAILESLEAADVDLKFESSLAAAGNVVLALPLDVPEGRESQRVTGRHRTPPEYITRSQFMLVKQARSGEALAPLQATGSSPPLESFARAALSLGHVYSLPDWDGLTRHEYLAIRYGEPDDYYPSLGLEMARVYLDIPRERMSFVMGEGVHLGDLLIPTDRRGRMLINYLGPHRTFRYVSAADVLRQRVEPGTFKGKIVLVGTAAVGTYDQKATPLSKNYPGVEKNATVVDNILRRQFVHKSLYFEPVDYGLILSFGLGLGYALPRMRALAGATLAVSMLAAFVLAAYLAFATLGIWLDVVHPGLTIGLVFVSVTVLRFMTEEKQSKEIRSMFSSYVNPAIVEELMKDPMKAKLGGQRKELTMLFSDVAGFTTFSERHSAEQVVAQLNEYLTAMTEVIFHWHGTLDKFVGDAIVVFWGAPLDQPNHVELAIKCALHMRQRLSELQQKWKAEGKIPFETGIGINTGEVLVGNIGAEGKKMDYTMIGDHVNLAARVEGLTRKVPYHIVLTEYTAQRVKSIIEADERGETRDRLMHVALRKLGAVKLVGKGQPVVAYGLESLGRDERSRIVEDAPDRVLEMTEK